jgi:hypothetical protein
MAEHRSISNLAEFNLVDAKNLNILTGYYHKNELNFTDKDTGKPVHIPEKYVIYRLTNSFKDADLGGFIVKAIELTSEQFGDFFENEEKFLSEWIFYPVLLDLDTDANNKKIVLNYVEKTNRYNIKK